MELPPARFDVNCSMLFTELPLLDRPQAARDAGFEAVELWWPFAAPVPSDREAEAFVRAVQDAGVALVQLNGTAGADGERGLASVPGREAEFSDNFDAVLGLAAALGCPAVHLLYGNRTPGASPQAQDELAAEHLGLAADRAAPMGVGIVVEALSGQADYPLRTADDVLRVLDRVRRPDVRFLCDAYHLTVNGEDVQQVVRRCAERIGHVQVADVPGRGEPGSGRLDLAGLLRTLVDVGYGGWVGLEYAPTTTTVASLAWLPPAARGAR